MNGPVTQSQNSAARHEVPRLDKWLWAARFFKTRALARTAIEGGKVHVNGERAKPSRTVTLGTSLTVQTEAGLYTITVHKLNDKRGPASVARTLYEEHPDSLARREAEQQRRRLEGDKPGQRPDKKQRRQLHQFFAQEPE